VDREKMVTLIAEELNLPWGRINDTIELLDADNTVPFLARYRKEATGGMDEDQIRLIQDRIRYLRNLQQRKETVLKSIAASGKLTPELEAHIRSAMSLQEVEDLYLPYKPKRRTRATMARERGLEPLAKLIWEQKTFSGEAAEIASRYVNTDAGVHDPQDALAGARDIVAEIVSENAEIRKRVREHAFEKGSFFSKARDPDHCPGFEIYKSHSEPVRSTPPHRILAINRGEREKILRAGIQVPEERAVGLIEDVLTLDPRSVFTAHFRSAISDAYSRLIAPAIEREIRSALTERADGHAIEVFAKNLQALLLSPPLRDRTIMGIDPGFRTGCKVAVIDSTGKYLKGTTVYPHEPQKQWDEAGETIAKLVQEFNVDVIAIGNGTASRETEKLIAGLISESEKELHYVIVDEAGASVYSASPVAKKEFPDLDASMRGNISIARRLLDPLSELVKIDPKSIGVGLYQHDVDPSRLSAELDRVVESAVNRVGVDVNTASGSLLKYVAGINRRLAENIIQYRESHGRFSGREQFKQVKGMGENAFLQAAGFLRIPDSDTFFDATAVHPESYGAAIKLLQFLDLDTEKVKSDGSQVRAAFRESKVPIDDLANLCGCGAETLMDIIDSLEKPNRDPRDDMPRPTLRSDILTMDDLFEGLVLRGTVRNVVDFGAFVDIGVKQDGLVHLSRMAKKYVKNPHDIVSVGDVIDVRVIRIDIERGRIGLSMVLDEPKQSA